MPARERFTVDQKMKVVTHTISPLWSELMIRRAHKNMDKWGVQDLQTLGLAIAEESGEVARAILKHRDEGGTTGDVTTEIIDLAALCFQTLVTIREKYGLANLISMLFPKQQPKAHARRNKGRKSK